MTGVVQSVQVVVIIAVTSGDIICFCTPSNAGNVSVFIIAQIFDIPLCTVIMKFVISTHKTNLQNYFFDYYFATRKDCFTNSQARVVRQPGLNYKTIEEFNNQNQFYKNVA